MTFKAMTILLIDEVEDGSVSGKSIASETLNFTTMFQMERKYISQAIQMSQVFQDAINDTTLKFEFNKALDLVRKKPEMAIIGTVNQSIIKQSCQVSAMVDEVIKLLNTVVGIALDEGSDTYNKFKDTITQGFTNLAAQENNAWIFWSSVTEKKTTYTYNVLYAVANKKTGSVMAAAPIGLTVTVDVEKEKVLFFTVTDKSNYEVNVQSIIVVEALQA